MTTSSEPDSTDRAWVDVDLGALVRNARRVAARSGARLLPMVKANGYGLGAVPVAKALEALDPWGFGVATVAEAQALRAAGIGRPILLCTPLLPRWIASVMASDLTPLIGDLQALSAWRQAAPARPFHLLIDTGMTRGGFRLETPGLGEALRAAVDGAPEYEGICTHFHSADADGDATAAQWSAFGEAVGAIGRPALVHAANSAAALTGSQLGADLVRPGIFLYGGAVPNEVPEVVARFRARVVAVDRVPAGTTVSYGATWRAPRETTIATVAAGYADGVLRALSSRGLVELHGRRMPILGRVTMDLTMVEAPEGTRPDDVATLYGGLVTVDEQATLAGTIAYELLTSIGTRVPRRHGGAP